MNANVILGVLLCLLLGCTSSKERLDPTPTNAVTVASSGAVLHEGQALDIAKAFASNRGWVLRDNRPPSEVRFDKQTDESHIPIWVKSGDFKNVMDVYVNDKTKEVRYVPGW